VVNWGILIFLVIERPDITSSNVSAAEYETNYQALISVNIQASIPKSVPKFIINGKNPAKVVKIIQKIP